MNKDLAHEIRNEMIRSGELTETGWYALSNVFPGAKPESIVMALQYCKARKLDPLKKMVHIVPMPIRDATTGEYTTRDVIMPGIAELRATAFRTGLYAGMDTPIHGETISHMGIHAPEYIEVTVYRLINGQRVPFPGRADFVEVCGTKYDKKTGSQVLNKMWFGKPRMMLQKVAEADALRRAFPEELGGEFGYEEYSPSPQEFDAPPPKKEEAKPINPTDHEKAGWSEQAQAENMKKWQENSDKKWPAVGTQNRAEDTPKQMEKRE